jgi:hypothetical protein
MPPQFTNYQDCCNRYSQQLFDNNNHVYVTQPVINERNHLVNYLNRTLIRDNNYHHYRVNHLYRDNVINRYYNQVFRTQRHFCDYSCSQACVPGVVTATPPVNTYHVMPCADLPPPAPAPAAAPVVPALPGPCCSA